MSYLLHSSAVHMNLTTSVPPSAEDPSRTSIQRRSTGGAVVGIRPGRGRKRGAILTAQTRRMSDFCSKCFLVSPGPSSIRYATAPIVSVRPTFPSASYRFDPFSYSPLLTLLH